MADEENKAIDMLEKFITEHKLFNIKQADNLENNIEKLLSLIEKQEKVIDEMAKASHLYFWTNDEKIMITHNPKENCHGLSIEEIKEYFYRKVENND